jgi:hypothetical protein
MHSVDTNTIPNVYKNIAGYRYRNNLSLCILHLFFFCPYKISLADSK